VTDRLISTETPGVLLLISLSAPVPYLHLHLESRRRFYPDVPLIVYDTHRAADSVVPELCAAYGALFYTPVEQIGPHGGEISAALLAIQAAQETGMELAVLMSDLFVPLMNWVPQLQHLASSTQYATYGGADLHPECVAFHAPSWAAGDTMPRLEQTVETGLTSLAAAGDFLHDVARGVHRDFSCSANAVYEDLYPPEPDADAFGRWPWVGRPDARQLAFLLRPEADTTLDYYRAAIAYGLDYPYRNFHGPVLAQQSVKSLTSDASLDAPKQILQMQTGKFEARVVTHDHGDFSSVTGSNVLIYLPHGFGDWVQFAAVLPFLDPSNRYYMTRFGDDTCAVMEGCDYALPLYGGSSIQPSNLPRLHFGLDYAEVDGTVKTLEMPLSLQRQCQRLEIDTVYWTDLPDPWGEIPVPYQTKARYQLPYIVSSERLAQFDLSKPLKNPISFDVSPWLTRWVESRLTTYGRFGERKLCLITRNGYTTIGKNWGYLYRDEVPGKPLREGEECRDFMRLLLHQDPRWMFLVMEDKLYQGEDTVRDPELNSYSYAEIFGQIGGQTPPFGLVLKALTNFASLSVGIPSGPYHLSMIKEGLPTIGLWTEQLPCWYDEPKAESLHLIGRYVHDRGIDQRPGCNLNTSGLSFRARRLDTRRIPGEDVFEAALELLS
jgi:hypothetical protein